ncbi:hypothetical protein [Bradyrhizobium sp. BR 10289]|uniref:hypothetical protein n=1 Tax=Bradyrhizobium sp. BR 10289 TaxID=2749993 RepID=UPI001C654368|nr:hypothetical protein [Bradyrhizobium sp. BR 10289]MBW7969514.1 hypothetical protein [Bradyrhizobium sp. BR 10289]
MDDEVEHLWFHGNGNLLAAQLAPVGVEKVIPEQKLHVENSDLTATSGNEEIKNGFRFEVCESAERSSRFTTIA